MRKLFSGVYENKKILLTGHTGFKGSWMAFWLARMGAEVIGLSLEPSEENGVYRTLCFGPEITDLRLDIRDRAAVLETFERYRPDFVFHFSALPIVRQAYEIPVETFETNLNGTLHVLEAIRRCETVRGAVFVNTDKVYENREWYWGYRENDPKGGHDPYSASKACCEIAIDSYRNSFFGRTKQLVASVRIGNTMGGGDWGRDRIVPDCIRAFLDKKPVELRFPEARRPWQYVLDPLSAYLLLGERLMKGDGDFAEAWNISPFYDSVITVKELAVLTAQAWGDGEVVEKTDPNRPYESHFLSIDNSKALFKLEWRPVLNIRETVEMTVGWYKRQAEGGVSMSEFTWEQILDYTARAKDRGLKWAQGLMEEKSDQIPEKERVR